MSSNNEFRQLQARLEESIIGQSVLVERLLLGLLADGHLLVEGVPGLAKTRTIKLLGEMLEGSFHRVQFTPDLLPADITGSDVFRPQDGSFHFEPGPLFHNLILADEINRAPAKVQSALLEAMAERQITVGKATYPLPDPFLVMATQNPIEHEGTHPLPEAQLDRFLLHVRVDYPDAEAERRILDLARNEAAALLCPSPAPAPHATSPSRVSREAISSARRGVLEVFLAPALETYIVQLVGATRRPEAWGDDLAGLVRFGASPRAGISLERCARARAWLAGRDYVRPDDLQALAGDVMRHRVLLSYEAEATGWTVDRLIGQLLARVPLP